jgi:amino acid adenylation domain-containing protein
VPPEARRSASAGRLHREASYRGKNDWTPAVVSAAALVALAHFTPGREARMGDYVLTLPWSGLIPHEISEIVSDSQPDDVDSRSALARTDWLWEFSFRSEHVAVHLEWAGDQCSAALAGQVLQQFEAVADSIANQSHARQAPRARPSLDEILRVGRGPERPLPAGTIADALRAHAASDAPAVLFAGHAITYRQLFDAADAVAAQLLAQGVPRGACVGVLMERGFELAIGCLAALLGEFVYVPLDVSNPLERIAFMLEDAAPAAVLTVPAFQSLTDGVAPTLLLNAENGVLRDIDGTDLQRLSGSRREPSVDPTGASAYMIYTSGTTGRPKGAINYHSSLLNRLAWMQREYGLRPDDRVLHKTSIGFDVSVWELLWPLLNGAQLSIASPIAHRDPEELAALFRDRLATVAHFVPSMLAAFVQRCGAESLRGLRLLITSGETLPADIARTVSGSFEGRFDNLYGPTEAAIDVTSWEIPQNFDLRAVPIGRPIDNVTTLIVDDTLAPQPWGVVGEIVIGGIAVGAGYHRRSELTKERFVELKEPDIDGRFYRTGDLGRFNDYGEIEFLGRADGQVKLRGHRIELEEVEAHLRHLPPIIDAAVAVSRRSDLDERLVAFVVVEDSGTIDSRQCRRALLTSLPADMIPAIYIVVRELPYSGSGKLDRRALSTMANDRR